jgi:hypothetical protein
MILARHFSAGIMDASQQQVPYGTAEMSISKVFIRPYRDYAPSSSMIPGTEVPG